MDIQTITPKLKLLNLRPPIPGFENFIGCYLFTGEKKAIVDCGPKTAIPNLLNALKGLGIGPQEIDYIILTHIHIDHAGGAGFAAREMSRARVIAHPRAHAHLADPGGLWKASLKTLGELANQYGEIEAVPEERILDASDGMKIELEEGLVLEILLTPGHAPHHMSLFERTGRLLVAGETAGVCLSGAVRPATAPPFNLKQALDSIDRLIALEPLRLCYGHFGCYHDAVERLRLMRQQMLDWRDIINGAAAATTNDPAAILPILREKDKSLDYLANLSRDEYARELHLILNSIRGLIGQ